MAQRQQRDPQGRFTIGNAGGPGRPKRQTEAGYLSVLMEECDLDQWRSVVKRAVADAADGNDKARAWLASYLVGQPAATAPAPIEVVVANLLGRDPALDAAAAAAAEPILSRERFPLLRADDDRKAAVRAEAAQAILEAESRHQTAPETR